MRNTTKNECIVDGKCGFLSEIIKKNVNRSESILGPDAAQGFLRNSQIGSNMSQRYPVQQALMFFNKQLISFFCRQKQYIHCFSHKGAVVS